MKTKYLNMFTLGKLWLKKPVEGQINIVVYVRKHGSVEEQIQNYLRIVSESSVASQIDFSFFLHNAVRAAIQGGQAELIATMPELSKVTFEMVEVVCKHLGYDEHSYNQVMQVIMVARNSDLPQPNPEAHSDVSLGAHKPSAQKTPNPKAHLGSTKRDDIAAHLHCIFEHIKKIEQLL